MIDPTKYPLLMNAIAVADAHYDYDECGCPVTEQLRDLLDDVRREDWETLDRVAYHLLHLELSLRRRGRLEAADAQRQINLGLLGDEGSRAGVHQAPRCLVALVSIHDSPHNATELRHVARRWGR